jgi:hypothetical protein
MTEVDTEDYLEVDTELPNQRFVVLSFISPENVLMKKELYFQSEFLKWLCVQSEFLENTVLKNNEGKTQLNYTNVKEKYDDFMFNNEEQLENQFHEMSDFKTSVRGVKVRGVYGSYREAEVRSKVLQKLHKRDNVFIGQVGYWLPWDPNPNRIENQEYLEPELNTLMKKYKENSLKRDIYYQEIKEQNMKDSLNKNKSEDVKEKLFNEEDTWAQRKKED